MFSDFEGLVTQSLLLANFEAAVEVCLHHNKMAEAITLAIAGGPELLLRTQKRFFKSSKSNLSRVSESFLLAVRNAEFTNRYFCVTWQVLFSASQSDPATSLPLSVSFSLPFLSLTYIEQLNRCKFREGFNLKYFFFNSWCRRWSRVILSTSCARVSWRAGRRRWPWRSRTRGPTNSPTCVVSLSLRRLLIIFRNFPQISVEGPKGWAFTAAIFPFCSLARFLCWWVSNPCFSQYLCLIVFPTVYHWCWFWNRLLLATWLGRKYNYVYPLGWFAKL